MAIKQFTILCLLAMANVGYVLCLYPPFPPFNLPYSAITQVQPHAITSTSDNILRSHGNLAQVATQTKTIDTPFSSSSKSDIRVSNPAAVSYAHFAHPATPLAYASAAIPAAATPIHTAPAALGVAYSPAVAVSHMSYSSPIGIAYAY